ncbi:MAG TPA: hypothetical protein VL485_15615 [Ktedonobacteraceae bacterium]|jgi:hypothetical protein|nr:hypothetical protein [Ktedonobacteraceae bacterium]
MQNRLPIDLIQAFKKPSSQFYLMVGGTVLLLAWLSVGLTPPTWWLLFQVIGQFKVLSAQSGGSVVAALLTLIGQSLLLLMAWVILIGIIVRGSARFQAVQPSTYAASPVSQLPVLPQSSASPSGSAATVLASPPARTAIENAQTVLISPDRASPIAWRTRIDEQPTIVVPPEPVRTNPRTSSVQSDYIAEMATRIVPLSSPDIQQSVSDPYASPPELQAHLKQPKWQSDDLSSDPFAPHEDILARSLQENPLLPTEDRLEQTQQTPPVEPVKPAQVVGPVQQQKQTAPTNKKEDGFVFGNPFEGVLPDVFEHDDDLKRSLKEQNSGSHSIDKAPRVKKQP